MNDDLISRQQAIDVIDKIFPADPMRNDYTQGITCGAALATEYIKQLPSVQPEPKPDKNGSEPFGNAEMLSDRTTDDCISRQAAIDAIKSRKTAEQSSAGIMRNAVVDFCIDIVKKLPSAQPLVIHCTDCEDWLERQSTLGFTISGLPSVQPEPKPDKNGSEPFGNAEMLGDRTTDDCISRQAAIRWVKTECNPYGKPTLDFESGKRVIEHLEQMPSSQPQIIHCTDCRHWKHSDVRKNYCEVFDWMNTAEDFCSFAERRTE